MQDHQAAYQTPFLSPQHALVADTVMDDVWVLVISDDHGPTAFLPLQRTGDRGRPLLDACNDGDGMVQRSGASLDVSGALRQVGLASFTFGHTPVVADGLCRFHEARALSSIVDLPFGFEDYAQQLRDRGSSVLSEAARKARRLAREEGDLRFDIDVEEGGAAAILVRMKAEQLPPVERERFLAAPVGEFITAAGRLPASEDYESILSVLWAGDTPVAVHWGLRRGPLLVSVVPAYSTALARCSPGLLLHIELLRQVEKLGVTRLELGLGANPVKKRLRTGTQALAAGTVEANPFRLVARRARNAGRALGRVGDGRQAPS